MKTRKSLIIWMACLTLILVLVLPYLFKIIGIVLLPERISVWKQLELYKWVAVGAALYVGIRHYLNQNIAWLETFSHELTHITVAMLTFRKVHGFQASELTGMVATSGKYRFTEILTSLAPYCLPVFTYALLFIRPLIDFHGRWIFDILIGITLCFHLICFKHQTGNHQTDIRQYPLYFSYLYIATAHVVNFCIIWVAFFPHHHVFSSFWRMVCAAWNQVLMLLGI